MRVLRPEIGNRFGVYAEVGLINAERDGTRVSSGFDARQLLHGFQRAMGENAAPVFAVSG